MQLKQIQIDTPKKNQIINDILKNLAEGNPHLISPYMPKILLFIDKLHVLYLWQTNDLFFFDNLDYLDTEN